MLQQFTVCLLLTSFTQQPHALLYHSHGSSCTSLSGDTKPNAHQLPVDRPCWRRQGIQTQGAIGGLKLLCSIGVAVPVKLMSVSFLEKKCSLTTLESKLIRLQETSTPIMRSFCCLLLMEFLEVPLGDKLASLRDRHCRSRRVSSRVHEGAERNKRDACADRSAL